MGCGRFSGAGACKQEEHRGTYKNHVVVLWVVVDFLELVLANKRSIAGHIKIMWGCYGLW